MLHRSISFYLTHIFFFKFECWIVSLYHIDNIYNFCANLKSFDMLLRHITIKGLCPFIEHDQF